MAIEVTEAFDLPIVITTAGLQPLTPAQILAQLTTAIAATNPGYTANLPASLVEDILSTSVGAIVELEQLRVETVNSLTPYGCNAFVLNQLGEIYGVELGAQSNTSVYVIFSAVQNGLPVAGVVIGKGFIVSDGTFQYTVQDGGATGSDGNTPQLFCLASQAGTWAVPAGTVTKLVTASPLNITLTVYNPVPGTPGTGAETETSYRSRVLQAGLVASVGMARMLRTQLSNLAGVQTRLVSARQQAGNTWEIIVGDGDPYLVAYAIYMSVADIATLVGSTLNILDATKAMPSIVETDLYHGFAGGQVIAITGVNPSGFNGAFVVLSSPAPTPTTFALGKAYAANNIVSGSWAGGTATLETTTAHGVTVGSTIVIVGCTPSGYNGTYVAIAGTTGTTLKYTIPDPSGIISTPGQLSAGVALFDATSLTYVSGGVITPNLRNETVTITDFPDTYSIPFVNPPQMTVTMTVTWNTSSPNYVSPDAVAQQAIPALVQYINQIPVGQPLNILQMEDYFQDAIENILLPQFLTKLDFAVAINGVGVSPVVGEKIIKGDPEGFFYAVNSGISVVQG